MATVTHDELEACPECVQYIANAEETQQNALMLKNGWTQDQINGLVVQSDGPVDEFTWRRCELCDGLAGTRYHAAILKS